MLRFILVLQLLALSFYSVHSDPCDEGYHYVNDPNTGTVGCIPVTNTRRHLSTGGSWYTPFLYYEESDGTGDILMTATDCQAFATEQSLTFSSVTCSTDGATHPKGCYKKTSGVYFNDCSQAIASTSCDEPVIINTFSSGSASGDHLTKAECQQLANDESYSMYDVEASGDPSSQYAPGCSLYPTLEYSWNSDFTSTFACAYDAECIRKTIDTTCIKKRLLEWSPVAITNTRVNRWRQVSASDDGTKVGAVDYGGSGVINSGGLWTSTDSGVTWNEIDTTSWRDDSSSTRNFYHIAISPDGTKWVSVANYGRIHTSTDGTTWTPVVMHNDDCCKSWSALTVSNDGRIIASEDGDTYYSEDFGATEWGWKSASVGSSTAIKSLAISNDVYGTSYVASTNKYEGSSCSSGSDCENKCTAANTCLGYTIGARSASVSRLYDNSGSPAYGSVSQDGKYIVVAGTETVYSHGTYGFMVKLSTNGGTSYVEIGDRAMMAVGNSVNAADAGISDDGQVIAVATKGKNIFVSTNGGSSWTPRAVTANWKSIAISGDGKKMVACEGSNIAVSTDSGTSWAWKSTYDAGYVAISGDGTKMAAVPAKFGTNQKVAVSTNSGTSWTYPSSSNAHQIMSVSISRDGTKWMSASQYGCSMGDSGSVVKVSNDGTSWSTFSNLPSDTFDNSCYGLVALGTTGDTITLVAGGKGIYQTRNGGSAWDKTSSGSYFNFNARSSGDGGKAVLLVEYSDVYFHTVSYALTYGPLVAGTGTSKVKTPTVETTVLLGQAGGFVSISTNGGKNWVAKDNSADFGEDANEQWSVSMSNDATIMAVAANGDNIHVSTDSGASWNPVSGTGWDTTKSWNAIAVSSDGTKMAACLGGFSDDASNRGVYVSTDSGVTWTEDTDKAVNCGGIEILSNGTVYVSENTLAGAGNGNGDGKVYKFGYGKTPVCTCISGTEATGLNCLTDGPKCASCDTGYILDANLCVPKQCTCANGVGKTGVDCATNGTESCASCDTGYSGAQCDVCVAGYHQYGTECRANQCTCTDGVGNTGPDCATDGDESCALCNTGYHYVNDPNTGTVGCIPNVCACAGGTPRSGENCTVHEAKQCVCTSAEYSVLDGNDITCETKQCTCPGGTSARGDNCPENGFEHCVSCNGNRKLSVNNRCDECQPGYYMDNNACVENQCTCSNGVGNTGVACATDGTQSCASCNTGSYGNLCDQTNQCVCPNGAAATGTGCYSNGATLCVSCTLGYDFVQSESCDVCQDGYAYKSTTETTCVVKECTCAHGQASFNTTCPTHGQEDCVSCDIGYSGVQCDVCIEGYHKEGNDCIVNQCTCAHGVATTNTSCATHNTESCASCDTGYSGAQCDVCVAGYHKDGTECKENQCTCARGVATTNTACATNNTESCASCDAGYDGATCDDCVSTRIKHDGICQDCDPASKYFSLTSSYSVGTNKYEGTSCSDVSDCETQCTADGTCEGYTYTPPAFNMIDIAGASKSWYALAMSGDGQTIVAAGIGTNLWTSVDGGANWNEDTSVGATKWFFDVAMSNDGKYVVAASNEVNEIYYSTDSGSTFAKKSPNPSLKFGRVAISDDGQTIAAAGGCNGGTNCNGRIMISTDGGGSWNERGSLADYSGIHMSSDGTKMIACAVSDRVYVSDNSGTSWTTVSSFASSNYRDCSMSADGSKMIVENNRNLHFCDSNCYTESSGNWAKIIDAAATPIAYWTTISRDGSTIIAGGSAMSNDDKIYTSTDDGATWTTHTVANTVQWRNPALSADGSIMAIAPYGDNGIWLLGDAVLAYGAKATVTSFSTIKEWGSGYNGHTDPNPLTGVVSVAGTGEAFAVVKSDGSVQSWGSQNYGGADPGITSGALKLFSTPMTFAALMDDGTIKTWGSTHMWSHGTPTDNGYVNIFTTGSAFAALKADGSITAWGNYGGTGAPTDDGYVKISATGSAFAALKADGSITAWGNSVCGVTGAPTDDGYVDVYASVCAFAAVKADGSVTVWGDAGYGGTDPGITGVTKIVGNKKAFAALKSDGSVVAWGDAAYGSTAPTLTDVIDIFANSQGSAFAALKSDGSVAAWGDAAYGGADPGIGSGVTKIVANYYAFAAIMNDGSVKAWGRSGFGGTDPSLESGVADIYATGSLFLAVGPSITTEVLDSSGGSKAVTRSECKDRTLTCAAGAEMTAMDSFNDNTCTNCTAGKYKAGDNTNACLDCAAGNYVFPPLGSGTQCLPCDPVTSYDHDGNSATGCATAKQTCDKGFKFFQTTDPLEDNLCLQCPYGYFQPNDGSAATLCTAHNACGTGKAFSSDNSVKYGSDSCSSESDCRNKCIVNNACAGYTLGNLQLVAWGNNDYGGDAPVLTGTVSKIFKNSYAFAALLTDGSVKAWGDSTYGGSDPAITSGVVSIYSTRYAFAALKSDGSVKAWGRSGWGGSDPVITSGVVNISSTVGAFAALNTDGSVTVWGDSDRGGSDPNIGAGSGITEIVGNDYSFAALKEGGSVTVWGSSSYGGCDSGTDTSSYTCKPTLTDVVNIFASQGAFAALKSDGTVVAWGQKNHGGCDSGTDTTSYKCKPTLSNVVNIFTNNGAFAALKSDGTVVAWGGTDYGSSTIPSTLANVGVNVVDIVSTSDSWAALKSDGGVRAWGPWWSYGSKTITSGIAEIFSTNFAFTALKTDGTVTSWGAAGGNVAPAGLTGVSKVFSTERAFAALKTNGAVVVWGNTAYGGSDPGIAAGSGITDIVGNQNAFATITGTGSKYGPLVAGTGTSFTRGSGGEVEITSGTTETDNVCRCAEDYYVSSGVCTACQGGTRLPGDDPSVDTSCCVDGFQSAIGAACTVYKTTCNAGETLLDDGTATSDKTCAPCPDGTYNTDGGACNAYGTTTCPDNEELTGGSATAEPTCSACPADQVSTGGAACDVCPANEYLHVANTTRRRLSTVYNVSTNKYEGTNCSSASDCETQCTADGACEGYTNNGGGVQGWGPEPYGGSPPAGLSGVVEIFSTKEAFAALKSDGSVKAWGRSGYGGNDPGISGVVTIVSTNDAFAALKTDGSVKAWGDSNHGGSDPTITSGVTKIVSTNEAFAALKDDGSVKVWGDSYHGGSNPYISSGIVEIFSNDKAFAALMTDGSVDAWGDSSSGGGSTSIGAGSSVTTIFSTAEAFAALMDDGSVKVWGHDSYGGRESDVTGLSNVVTIYSSHSSFAALKTDGSVKVWGSASDPEITSGVTKIFSNTYAFAALKTDGSVQVWGSSSYGGTDPEITSGVVTIFSTERAFAALKSDGSVKAWGDSGYGGDDPSITSGVSTIVSNTYTFAALMDDGSVKAWGHSTFGGADPGISGVTKIFSNHYTFAAITNPSLAYGPLVAGTGDSFVKVSVSGGSPQCDKCCVSCDSGTASAPGGTCQPFSCSETQYYNSTHCLDFLDSCPVGEQLTGGHAFEDKTCSACPDGTFKATTGSDQCANQLDTCGPGQQLSGGSASEDKACVDCPTGTFNTGGPTCANQIDTCINDYELVGGSTSTDKTCSACPGNLQSTGGATCRCPPDNRRDGSSCFPCYLGEISDDGVTCVACAADEYRDDRTCKTRTLACPAGETLVNSDVVTDNSCVKCLEGTYKSLTDDSQCLSCDDGSYIGGADGENKGGKSCTPCVEATEYDHDENPHTGCVATNSTCPAGQQLVNFNDNTKRNLCENCPAGTFKASAGAEQCQPHTVCASGETSLVAHSASVDRVCVCAEDHISINGVCQACGSGIRGAGDDKTANTTCCVADQYNGVNGECKNKTETCDPGHEFTLSNSKSLDNTCSACESGKFSLGGAVTCQSWTECSGTQTESVVPSSSNDRKCLCNEDTRVSNGGCVACVNRVNAAGDDPLTGDTQCDCLLNEYVSSNQCAACSGTDTRPAGDDPMGQDTHCTVVCAANQRVKDNQCVACASGLTNGAGDTNENGDTYCEGTAQCANDQKVVDQECVSCDQGKHNNRFDNRGEYAPGLGGRDTTCDWNTCAKDEYADNKACVACVSGFNNAGDSVETDTICDDVDSCDVNEHVSHVFAHQFSQQIIHTEGYSNPISTLKKAKQLCLADASCTGVTKDIANSVYYLSNGGMSFNGWYEAYVIDRTKFECVACPGSSTRPAGDIANITLTQCTFQDCNVDQSAKDYVCSDCTGGLVRSPASNPMNDFICTMEPCNQNERVGAEYQYDASTNKYSGSPCSDASDCEGKCSADNVCQGYTNNGRDAIGWGVSGKGGDLPTLTGSLIEIVSTSEAFAALKTDGSVQVWGRTNYGGADPGITGGVQKIYSNVVAFAALKTDGSVTTWGSDGRGGCEGTPTTSYSTCVPNGLTGVTKIFSNSFAFAALKSDGSVQVWGDTGNGGADPGLGTGSGVTEIFSNLWAFVALKSDGSVKAWGYSDYGGNNNDVASLTGVTKVVGSQRAFAALKTDGSVQAWGDSDYGGSDPSITSGVIEIVATDKAFAALKSDGSVQVWGAPASGGTDPNIEAGSGITKIFANKEAFAALKTDGSVQVWGDSWAGGKASSVASLTGVTKIFPNWYAFAALKDDGSVKVWGASSYGGCDSGTAAYHTCKPAGLTDVTDIFSTKVTFAALKSDGSVVAWGQSVDAGGVPVKANVAPAITGVTDIYSNDFAYVAVKGPVFAYGPLVTGMGNSKAKQTTGNSVCTPCPAGFTNEAGDTDEFGNTHCDPTFTCGKDEYASNFQCLPCALNTFNNAGDNPAVDSTCDDTEICDKNEYPDGSTCQACPGQGTRDGGELATVTMSMTDCTFPDCQSNQFSSGDGVCQACPPGRSMPVPISPLVSKECLCAKDQYADGSTCSNCNIGFTNEAGDDPSGNATLCDLVPCAVGQYVSGTGHSQNCVDCDPGTSSLGGFVTECVAAEYCLQSQKVAYGFAASSNKYGGASCSSASDCNDKCAADGTCEGYNTRSDYMTKQMYTAGNGGDAVCAIQNDGTVKCWGYSSKGLGDGSTYRSDTPITVSGISTAVKVCTPGSRGACALLSDGTMKCWGHNQYGQFGDGTTTNSQTPVPAGSGLNNIVDISCAPAFRCAVLSDGTVKCWGAAVYGRLGEGTSGSDWSNIKGPTTVTGISKAVAIDSSEMHTCVVLSTGAMKCWGESTTYYPRLGSSINSNQATPVDVGNTNKEAVQVFASAYHTCAVMTDGTVYCWGRNDDGQIGSGSTSTVFTNPTQVSDITNAIDVSLGYSYSCATLSDGKVKCWGKNDKGQLGDGTTTERRTAVSAWEYDISDVSISQIIAGGRANADAFVCILYSNGDVKCRGRNDQGQLGDGTKTDSWNTLKDTGIQGSYPYIFTGVYGPPVYGDVGSISLTEVASTTNGWRYSAMSTDGAKRLAATSSASGSLWASITNGDTWNKKLDVAHITSISMSGDGTKIMVCHNYNTMLLSTNSGESFSSSTGSYFNKCAMSSDGTKMVAASSPGKIYTYDGTSWTESYSISRTWTHFSMSSDGTKITAAANWVPIIYSHNGGASWLVSDLPTNKAAIGLTSSADGMKLAAPIYNDKIYYSHDGGVTWLASDSITSNWAVDNSITSSADGTKLVAAAFNSNFLISTDSGVSWVEDSAQHAGRDWRGPVMSADGTKIMVGVSSGNLQMGELTFSAAIKTTSENSIARTAAGCVDCPAKYENDQRTPLLGNGTLNTCVPRLCLDNEYSDGSLCQSCEQYTGAASAGINPTDVLTTCSPMKCGENQYVENHECKNCDISKEYRAAGDHIFGGDTHCFCKDNSKVVNGVCQECEEGSSNPNMCYSGLQDHYCTCIENYFVNAGLSCEKCPGAATNAAGDYPGFGQTHCTCGEGQRVQDNACVFCGAGRLRAAGDEASGANTECSCAFNEYVSSGVCTTCPENSERQAQDFQANGDTTCTCKEGFKVSGGACVAVEAGGSRAAGDPVDGGDTFSACDEGYHVQNNLCVICPSNQGNPAGNDATGGNTTCTCLVNHYSNGDGTCSPCTSGVMPTLSDPFTANTCLCEANKESDGSGGCNNCDGTESSVPGEACKCKENYHVGAKSTVTTGLSGVVDIDGLRAIQQYKVLSEDGTKIAGSDLVPTTVNPTFDGGLYSACTFDTVMLPGVVQEVTEVGFNDYSATQNITIEFDDKEYNLCTGDTSMVSWNGEHNIQEVTEVGYNVYNTSEHIGPAIHGFENASTVKEISGLEATGVRYFVCTLHPSAKFKTVCNGNPLHIGSTINSGDDVISTTAVRYFLNGAKDAGFKTQCNDTDVRFFDLQHLSGDYVMDNGRIRKITGEQVAGGHVHAVNDMVAVGDVIYYATSSKISKLEAGTVTDLVSFTGANALVASGSDLYFTTDGKHCVRKYDGTVSIVYGDCGTTGVLTSPNVLAVDAAGMYVNKDTTTLVRIEDGFVIDITDASSPSAVSVSGQGSNGPNFILLKDADAKELKIEPDVCTSCAPGSLRAAGDDKSVVTACTASVCNENERVVSNACQPCISGMLRAAGDLATGADTSCGYDGSVHTISNSGAWTAITIQAGTTHTFERDSTGNNLRIADSLDGASLTAYEGVKDTSVAVITPAGPGTLYYIDLDNANRYGIITVEPKACVITGSHVVLTEPCQLSGEIVVTGPLTIEYVASRLRSGATLGTTMKITAKVGRHFRVNGGSLSLKGIELTGGSADEGGAILVENGNIDLDNVKLSENTASGEGGAIRVKNSASNVKLSNVLFDKNVAPSGGAMSMDEMSSEVDIERATFTNNKASQGDGGAIKSNARMKIQMSVFDDNEAPAGGGGGIYTEKDVNMTGSQMKRNKANNGGAMKTKNNAVHMSLTTMEDNEATSDGGAIDSENTAVDIETSTIKGNKAKIGGAVRSIQAGCNFGCKRVSIRESSVENNEAEEGAALDVDGGANDRVEIWLQDSTLTGNTITKTGGKKYKKRHLVKIRNIDSTVEDLDVVDKGCPPNVCDGKAHSSCRSTTVGTSCVCDGVNHFLHNRKCTPVKTCPELDILVTIKNATETSDRLCGTPDVANIAYVLDDKGKQLASLVEARLIQDGVSADDAYAMALQVFGETNKCE